MAKKDLNQVLTELKTLVGEELKVNAILMISNFAMHKFCDGHKLKWAMLAVCHLQMDLSALRSFHECCQADPFQLCRQPQRENQCDIPVGWLDKS